MTFDQWADAVEFSKRETRESFEELYLTLSDCMHEQEALEMCDGLWDRVKDEFGA